MEVSASRFAGRLFSALVFDAYNVSELEKGADYGTKIIFNIREFFSAWQ
jgi:hypothetical protein